MSDQTAIERLVWGEKNKAFIIEKDDWVPVRQNLKATKRKHIPKGPSAMVEV